MKKIIYIILSVIVVLGLGGWYLATEADAAGPGDLLYPVDTTAEAIERFFTFDDIALAEFEQEVLDERVDELEALVDEETIDEELVLGATEEVSAQRARLQTHIEEGEATQEGSMEQVQNRYEVQAEEHIQIMEKVETKATGEDTQQKVQEAVKGYEESLKGSSGSSGNGNGK
jgi:hypothetical protein